MATIKKTDNSKCWPGCGQVRTRLLCWWECKVVQLLWKTAWWFLKEANRELPYGRAVTLLGTCPREIRTYVLMKTCTQWSQQYYYSSQNMETTQMPVMSDQWMDRQNVVWGLPTAEHGSAMRSEALTQTTTWMSLENVMRSERSQM